MAQRKSTRKASPPKEISVRLNKVFSQPDSPTKAVTHVLWTRVGNDVQLELGAVDLGELRNLMVNATSDSGVKDLPLRVYDRYLLTMGAIAELKKLIDDVTANLKDRSVLADLALSESVAERKH